MTHNFKSLIITASLSGATLLSTTQAQVITGFGIGDFEATVPFGGLDSQSLSAYFISGSDFGSQLYGSFTPVFVGQPSSIFLTGTMSTSVSSAFQIQLFDADGGDILYQANWSSFNPLNSEIMVPLTYISDTDFNGTAVSFGLLTTGGISPGSTVSISLNTLSAIPEPATFAALAGMATLGLAAVRRRKRAV